uniref:Kazal-like domain-containing protein n=1 Tax=Rhabditophanes sp. KR3021 TaxID=114890 RepID=A0AC35THL6_9BILA
MVFLPKYLENHYGIPQYKVHLAIAGFGVFGFASGTINGGILTKLYKLTGRQAAILVFIISAINCSFFLGKTFLGCHSIVNSVGAKGLQTHFNFTESCNVDCSCESSTIYPVCTETGVPFYSPCHAGCRGVNVISQNPIQLEFSNCECAPGSIVKKEFCKDDCEWMTKIFFVTVILGGFVAGTGVVPGMLLLIRSVPPETRSISLGLQGFVVSLIGTLPSPILYGAVIDSACLVWDRTCGDGDGHCSIYDPTKLRVRLHLLYCCIRLISMMTDIWVIYYSKHINILEEVKGTEETDEANDLAMKTFPPQPIAE